jgi:hypothetical protein
MVPTAISIIQESSFDCCGEHPKPYQFDDMHRGFTYLKYTYNNIFIYWNLGHIAFLHIIIVTDC